MERVMEWLAEPMMPALIALMFLAVILAIMLLRAMDRDKNITRRLAEVEQVLSGLFRSARSEGDQQAQRSREELSSNLRGMGDSVTRLMNEMARTQQGQLDAFAGQMRDMQRVDEQRMDDMRQAVETRLMAYEDRMDKIGDVLDSKLDKNESRLERMRETVEVQMGHMQQENNRRLDEMRQAVDEKLNATLDKRLGESFRQVSDRLDQVYQGLGEMQSLASGVGELKRVLTSVRARGLVGEVQLGALLSQIMAPSQYEMQVRVRPNGAPVDYAVKIPSREGEGDVLLPIDAGFPLDVYNRLLDALDVGNQPLVEQLDKELQAVFTQRAQYIAANFIAAPRTTGFAVMFLPVEGLYAEALRKPGLPDHLQREYGVTLTGPATLTALLNSLQMGLKAIALEKRSGEVWALLGAVRGEFAQFADALARTQKRIRQASESIEDAARRSRTIEKRLKGVKKLDAAEAGLIEEDDGAYGNDSWD